MSWILFVSFICLLPLWVWRLYRWGCAIEEWFPFQEIYPFPYKATVTWGLTCVGLWVLVVLGCVFN